MNDNKTSRVSYKKVMGSGGERILAKGERPQNTKQTTLNLLARLKPEKITLSLILLLVLVENGINLILPLLLGKSMDWISQGNLLALGKLLLLMAVLYLMEGILRSATGIIMAKASQRVMKTMRTALFDKMLHLPMKYYDTANKGDLMSRLTNDMDNISSILSTSVIQFINAFITIIGSLAMMSTLSLPLTGVVVGTILLSGLLTKVIAGRTRGYFRDRSKELGTMNRIIEENIQGFEIVKLFSKEKDQSKLFHEVNRELQDTTYRSAFLAGILLPMMNAINNLRLALLAITGGYLILSGQVTIGVIAAFFGYSRKFNRPIGELASISNLIQSALAGAERIFEVLEEEQETTGMDNINPRTLAGRVEFANISFAYNPDRPVLREVSFCIEPGQTVAVVGATGAGKTTLANLLIRFYEPDSGQIYIDGNPLSNIEKSSLQNILGVVPQEPILFSGTLRDNIIYPWFSEPEEKVVAAATIAGCHELIGRLPQGYDTWIDPSATILSQGEKQLITIARAVIKDPIILVLDEATSSVDTQTEKKIQQTLMRLQERRTTFIIAHRLSTIKEADQIIVLGEHRILEMGSHQDLLKRKGNYSKMYHSQFSI